MSAAWLLRLLVDQEEASVALQCCYRDVACCGKDGFV